MSESAENKKTASYESELRQDIVTGDWVVIATGRAKRPDDFASSDRASIDSSNDPFENPEESGQEKDVLIYRRDDGDWSLRVIPNKFPAFTRGRAVKDLSKGPYFAMSGVGYHEVVITRDKERSLALLETWQVAEVLDAYHERYLALMNKKSVNYIQVFHNHGKESGSSIQHPHSQLMAIPVISPYVSLGLVGSEQYYKAHQQNVFDVLVEYETEQKERLVYENEHFVVFCPYASRAAFEMWVVGKRHNPYFERITDDEKFACAEALKQALALLYKGLNNPAYNFYINTAPCDGKDYPHYQWHIEIVPRMSTWGGLELATGIEVSTIQPEKAAEYLRSVLPND
ncbi:MAG: DUF4921 family protein [Patescibacteria group bacterium]